MPTISIHGSIKVKENESKLMPSAGLHHNLMPKVKPNPDHFKTSNSTSGSKTRIILTSTTKDPKKDSTYIQPEVIITKVEKHHQSLKGSYSKASSTRAKQLLNEMTYEGDDRNELNDSKRMMKLQEPKS